MNYFFKYIFIPVLLFIGKSQIAFCQYLPTDFSCYRFKVFSEGKPVSEKTEEFSIKLKGRDSGTIAYIRGPHHRRDLNDKKSEACFSELRSSLLELSITKKNDTMTIFTDLTIDTLEFRKGTFYVTSENQDLYNLKPFPGINLFPDLHQMPDRYSRSPDIIAFRFGWEYLKEVSYSKRDNRIYVLTDSSGIKKIKYSEDDGKNWKHAAGIKKIPSTKELSPATQKNISFDSVITFYSAGRPVFNYNFNATEPQTVEDDFQSDKCSCSNDKEDENGKKKIHPGTLYREFIHGKHRFLIFTSFILYSSDGVNWYHYHPGMFHVSATTFWFKQLLPAGDKFIFHTGDNSIGVFTPPAN
jgi:hypothetical protein